MSSERISHADGDLLMREIADNDLVLVDFWAAWCAPCRAMGPVIDRIADTFPNVKVMKVDAEAHADLLTEYGIKSLPTIQIFRAGKRVEQLNGKVPYTMLERALQITT